MQIHLRMRLALLPLLALSFALPACSGATTTSPGGSGASSGSGVPLDPDPGPPLSSAPKILGSYQITFKPDSSARYYLPSQRLDLLGNAQDGIDAYTFDGKLRKNKLTVFEDRIELAWADSTTNFQKVTIRRSGEAKLTTLSAEVAFDKLVGQGLSGTLSVTGEIDVDKQSPSLSYFGQQGPPWEPLEVAFSEPLLARDITLPSRPGYIFALAPYPGTPWMAGFTIRSDSWDSAPNNGVTVPFPEFSDPSGNPSRAGGGQLSISFLPVGPAVAGYDFDRDEPAWKGSGTVRGTSDCEAESCLRLRNRGASAGFRLAAGKRKVTLRLRSLSTVSGPSKVPLSLTLVSRGGKSSESAEPEMTFTPLAAPTAGFTHGTPWVDLPVDLPESGVETGISLRVSYPPPRVNPSAPPGIPYAVLVERVTAE